MKKITPRIGNVSKDELSKMVTKDELSEKYEKLILMINEV
jgi:hypothetical protein